jgi:CheY-like chemotaxis protein
MICECDDALQLMSAEPAAVVLCDVMMPVHDGIWLAEQVRTRWPQTAVIMASSAQDMETVMREMLRQALQRASEG